MIPPPTHPPKMRFVASKSWQPKVQGPPDGGVSNGGFPDLDLSFLFCPFLSFLGLSRFFRDFPDLLGDGPGIFPICPFPLSRPIKSTYEEQSRKGPRHNLDLSRKVSGKPPGLASLKKFHRAILELRGGGTQFDPKSLLAGPLLFREPVDH